MVFGCRYARQVRGIATARRVGDERMTADEPVDNDSAGPVEAPRPTPRPGPRPLLFVIFDVEVVFLYPWAVVFRQVGPAALVEIAIFIGILLVGLGYAWRHGALRWT